MPSINKYKFKKRLTIPGGQIAQDHSGGWYPIVLGNDNDIQAAINSAGSDIAFTESDSQSILPHVMIAKGGICALDGVWTFFNQPVAAFNSVSNKTLVAFVDRYGSRSCTQYDHATGTSDTFLISTTDAVVDDHNNPAVGVCADGKWLVAYTEHPGTRIKVRRSSSVGDASSWESEVMLDFGSGLGTYTYCQLWRLGNTWYLITRENESGGNIRWSYVTSTDDGDNWSSEQVLIDGTGRAPYLRTFSDGSSIWFFFTPEAPHPGDDGEGLLVFQFDGSTFRNVDAEAISLPITSESDLNASSIICSDPDTSLTTNKKWVSDITLDSSGMPRVLWYDYPEASPAQSIHDLWCSRWTGSQWISSRIMQEGTAFYSLDNSYNYAGIAVFDPLDANTFTTAVERNGVREIEQYKTEDGGATFTRIDQLTTGSTKQMFRPNYAHGMTSKVKTPYLFWVGNGNYSQFDTTAGLGTLVRAFPPQTPAQVAWVKFDTTAGSDKELNIFYGGLSIADSNENYTQLKNDFGDLVWLGSVPSVGDASLVKRYYGVKLYETGLFPAFDLRETSNWFGSVPPRMHYATEYNSEVDAAFLMVASWTEQDEAHNTLIGHNKANSAGVILRHDKAVSRLEFFVQTGSPAVYDTLNTPNESSTDNGAITLISAGFDSTATGEELYVRIRETQTTGAGSGNPFNSAASGDTVLGQASDASTVESFNGILYFFDAKLSPSYEKTYTDNLSRAFSHPFVNFGSQFGNLITVDANLHRAVVRRLEKDGKSAFNTGDLLSGESSGELPARLTRIDERVS